MLKNISNQSESDKLEGNRVNRGDCMALNSKGGRIIHTMADGTVTEDLAGYIEAHPEIQIPPTALHVMKDIFVRSLSRTEA